MIEKILLVDDSQPFNFLSKTVLKENKVDCVIIEALNGKAALDYLTHNDKWPEVILLDINMPVMDGFQFLEEYEKLNKAGQPTKIFVLTSSTRDEDREKSLSFNTVVEYFDKPLNTTHVKRILSVVKGQ
jgi:CheY-like chemotaxis protein